MSKARMIGGILAAFFWIGCFSSANAASKVIDGKFQDLSVASYQEFRALPIEIDESVDINTGIKMDLIIKNEWSKIKVPIQWRDEEPDKDEEENAEDVGILQIHVSSYYWDNYWVEGYYEDYIDTEYYDDWYWENEYRDGKYVGQRRVLVRRSYQVLRTRYVPPRYVKQAIVQASFIIRDGKTDEVIWYYDQDRLDTVSAWGKNPTLEKSLEIISKESAKAFEKIYKKDQKELKKNKK